MFSYGMVLYELLSGRRPALGHHQLQIAKKLSKGIRPVLGSPEEVQFYCLHSLLTECWDTKPEKVSIPASSHYFNWPTQCAAHSVVADLVVQRQNIHKHTDTLVSHHHKNLVLEL